MCFVSQLACASALISSRFYQTSIRAHQGRAPV